MTQNNRLAVWAAVLVLSFGAAQTERSFPKDEKLKPEELIAEHLKSIGSPDVLAQTKSRAFIGTTTVTFLQGATGQLKGQAQFASDGRKFGIVMRYDALEYPGEHFAFDGKDVTIGRFTPGRISPLADFINQYGDVMKEGLLGGVLSVAWPLQRIQEMKPRLKYSKTKVGGRPMHALEYIPRKGLSDFKIIMFFDLETFRHLRTEYRLRISATIGTGAATIQKEVSDAHYLLSEDFEDFKEIDGMMLPQRYTISFSAEGPQRTFLAHWTLEANQWIHNGQIDSQLFNAN